VGSEPGKKSGSCGTYTGAGGGESKNPKRAKKLGTQSPKVTRNLFLELRAGENELDTTPRFPPGRPIGAEKRGTKGQGGNRVTQVLEASNPKTKHQGPHRKAYHSGNRKDAAKRRTFPDLRKW